MHRLLTGGPNILKDNATEERGENARLQAFIGAIAIGDLVKSTLGPKGMDKILQGTDRQQSVRVTNDGATILEQMDIDNEIAQLMVELSKSQDSEIGDGTTSVIVLTGEFLSLAKPLLITMSSGTLIGRLEGWNLCDSFYFSIMTATTIGFGDFSPSTRAGRTVAIALIPVMLAAAANVLARVSLFITRNRTRRLFESPAERAEWLTEAQAIEMDLDGNGRVSKSEYVLYMLLETGIIDREECLVLEEQFERFDVTKSGYIESGDLKAMKKFRENLQRKSRRGE